LLLLVRARSISSTGFIVEWRRFATGLFFSHRVGLRFVAVPDILLARVYKPEFPNGCGNLCDLGFAVGSGVVNERHKPINRPALDALDHRGTNHIGKTPFVLKSTVQSSTRLYFKNKGPGGFHHAGPALPFPVGATSGWRVFT